MTTNHHTPILVGAAADAATVNTPLGELDQAISNVSTAAGGSKLFPWPEADPVIVSVSTKSAYSASGHTNWGTAAIYTNNNSYTEIVQVTKMMTYSINRRFATLGVVITQPLDFERFTFFGRMGIASNLTPAGATSTAVYSYFGNTLNPLTNNTDFGIENWSAATITVNATFLVGSGAFVSVQPVYTWIEAKKASRQVYAFDNPVTSTDASASGKTIGLQLTPGPGHFISSRAL